MHLGASLIEQLAAMHLAGGHNFSNNCSAQALMTRLLKKFYPEIACNETFFDRQTQDKDMTKKVL